MTGNKRFRVTIGNENDVKFVDYVDNRQLISISFKDYNDAVDCRDALLYQCNMMNELHEENKELKTFKDKVFEVIDNHILEETDLRKEFIENGSHYSANISRNIIDTLKLIKMELSK